MKTTLLNSEFSTRHVVVITWTSFLRVVPRSKDHNQDHSFIKNQLHPHNNQSNKQRTQNNQSIIQSNRQRTQNNQSIIQTNEQRTTTDNGQEKAYFLAKNMYTLPEKKSFKLEYAFCQTDTFDNIDRKVIEKGGVCLACATDWLLAKVDGEEFVFSEQTVFEKRRVIEEVMKKRGDAKVLQISIPLESKMEYAHWYQFLSFGEECGDAIARTVQEHDGVIVMMYGNGPSHALAFCKTNERNYMFDSNFGSYETSTTAGVVEWWKTLISHVRAGKGDYSTHFNSVKIFPFAKKNISIYNEEKLNLGFYRSSSTTSVV